MKRLLTILGLVLGAVLIGFALLEGMTRVIMPDWDAFASERFLQLAEVPGFRPYLAGTKGFQGKFAQNNGDFTVNIAINDTGQREEEPKSVANGRIWGVGDSFTFGWGVEKDETYVAVLGRLVGKPTYNLAGPGNDVCGYQAEVMSMPEPRLPAAVVVGLTIENDIEDDRCQPGQYVPPPASSVAASNPINFLAVKDWLLRNSALYGFTAVAIKKSALLNQFLITIGLLEQPHGAQANSFLQGNMDTRIATTIAELAWLRGRFGPETPFAVLLIPGRFDLRDRDPFFAGLRQKLTDELRRRSITVVDPYDDLAQAGFEASHHVHDGHWSARGHDVAARSLARWYQGISRSSVP